MHSGLDDDGACGGGVVIYKMSVGRGGRNTEKDPARLPPGCQLVTLVAKVPLPGLCESNVVVSVECSPGTDGGANGAQLFGRGPQSSLASWYLESFFLVS